MTDRSWSRVVNIPSGNGIKSQFGQASYSAAKAGALGFTKGHRPGGDEEGASREHHHPGYIGTAMVMAIKPEVCEQIIAIIPMTSWASQGRPVTW